MLYRYIIQCERMSREEVLIVKDAIELLQQIERYIVRHGRIEILYRTGAL